MQGISSSKSVRKAGWFSSALVVLAFASCIVAAPGAQASPASESFVQQEIDRGYAILNSAALSPDQRHQQFRELLLELVDTRRIGIFTLGQYAAGASPTEIDAFVAAFTNYVVGVYELALSKSEGQILKVTGSADRDPKNSIVKAELVSANRSNGEPIRTAFRVRAGANGEPTITDLQVEGVWLAIGERADFTSYLQQHNGSVATLTARLNMMADQLAGDSRPQSWSVESKRFAGTREATNAGAIK